MRKPLELTLYNPDQLEDRDFLDGFVARHELADKILGRLGEINRRGLAQHRLIVGQRGMGKTSLLRRIALGVCDQPSLAAVLLPLRFREEQYNVHNLHVLWCNCLDALGDWFEATGRLDQAERLDRDVAALNAQDDDEEGTRALESFRTWMHGENRRPLLLLDNLDIIFASLKDKQWSLRRALQEAGGIVVVGASAAALEAAADREGAFYDFFQVDVLAKLEHHEILVCLRRLARQRNDAGRRVLQILDRDPARIHVLHDLTGGNPRTLAMLYLVLETSGDEDVMRDLERLLDQATPLYKARVEELAPQARVVFDALALAWDPATAAELAAVTGLAVSTVSTQLDRLFKDGIAEKTSLSSTSRVAFQVAERFFNIWYLMRHSPRRQRLRLRWLTEMLRRIYSPRELRERATGLLGGAEDERFSRVAYCLALSDAVEDRELRVALRSSVRRHSPASEGGDLLDDDLSLPVTAPDSIPMPGDATAETYRKAIELDPRDSGLWNGLGKLLLKLPEGSSGAEAAFRKAIELDPKDAAPWNGLGNVLADSLGRYAEAEAAYRTAVELDPKNSLPWDNLGRLLAGPLGRYPEAEAAYRMAVELDPKNVFRWNRLGNLLADLLGRYAEAEAAYRAALELDPRHSLSWTNLGRLLAGPLGRHAEAEEAVRKAIELDPRDAWSWNNLGDLLAGGLGRHAEAEAAYRTAVELDPMNAWPWTDLGRLLAGQLGRYAEAEAAYRAAVEIDPKNPWPWNYLGDLLADSLGRYVEAEAAYRAAIELDPNVWSWTDLGRLLAGQLGRYAEAEAAYRAAIELDPKNAWPWNNLGILLADSLGRHGEAEAACRRAIDLNPRNAAPWNNLGNLLAGPLGRYAEAEAAYRTAVELDPRDAAPWNNLGNLLAGPLRRYAEAEAAYRTAVELDPRDAAPWNNLGNLLAVMLGRYAEAEAAYRTAVELDPMSALSWTNFGRLLAGPLGRNAEAEAAYRKAIELDPKSALRWSNLGNLLAGPLGRYAEAEAAYRKAIELDPKDTASWNAIGNLLADHLFRPDEAEKAYREAMRIDPENPSTAADLVYLLLRNGERTPDAESIYRVAIAALPSHGAGLLRTFYALAADNYGAAVTELEQVLTEGHEELFTVFRDDLLRILQFAADRGYGDKLLTWLESSVLGGRYWPLQVAFDAYLHGEERLMDVNPEVRSGARHLLAEMTPRLAIKLDEPHKSRPKEKRRGGKRRAVKSPKRKPRRGAPSRLPMP